MAHPPVTVQGFVYAEDRDGGRALGFKLLAPKDAPWSAEVEALARRLHACPYPETWPPVELFCSVLLEGGQRLVALARYGVRDHTPGQRPGGLELLGAVGPSTLDLETARALARHLRERRLETDQPLTLAAETHTAGLPVPPELPPLDPRLPLRLTRVAGTLLLTGAAPDEPDRALRILEAEPDASWQWLPYCGPDFPFETFAQRGPLIAWAPPRADLALFLSRPRAESVSLSRPSPSRWPGLILAAWFLLLALNLYAWWTLPARLPPPPAPRADEPPAREVPARIDPPPQRDTRDRFVQALHRLLARQGEPIARESLKKHYARLVREDPDLRCDNPMDQDAIAALDLLARSHPDQVARAIQEVGDKKGFDPEVLRLIAERVRLRLKSNLEE